MKKQKNKNNKNNNFFKINKNKSGLALLIHMFVFQH